MAGIKNQTCDFKFSTFKEPKNGRLREANNEIKVRHLGIREELNEFNIYTDGSAVYKKSNSVGYSFIIANKEGHIVRISRGQINVGKKKKKLSSLYAETVAVLKAIEYIHKNLMDNVKIYTDNLYIFKAVKGYDKHLNPVLHAFINQVKALVTKIHYDGLHIDIEYIKGHSGIIENELADYYAKDSRKKRSNWTSTSIDTIDKVMNKLTNEYQSAI